MKKRRRKLAFSCVSSDACRLRGTPAGDFYIAVSGQKFLRIVKGLFSKSPLTGVWGGAPHNTCRCGARGSAPYISRGARGRASHISVGVWGGAPLYIHNTKSGAMPRSCHIYFSGTYEPTRIRFKRFASVPFTLPSRFMSIAEVSVRLPVSVRFI